MEQDYRPSKDVKDAVVVWSGTTTSAGNVGGTTLVDSGLTQGNNYWINMVVLIKSGSSNGQARRISVFAAGTLTVDTAFASQIASGTKYDILGQHANASGAGGDATLANQILMLADIGDASASTLGSLYGIVGNPAAGQDLATRIGYEGAASLADKLTTARAGYLDFLPPLYYGLVSASNQATGGGASTITLAAGASAVNDFYKGQIVTIYAGAGAGQARAIVSYDGGTKIATVSPSWATQPDATSFYIIIANGSTVVAPTSVGNSQVLEVSITSAANAGDVTVATVTTQPCIIDSIIIHADAAQTADLTTCAVTGGASKVITFISTNDATQANLDAADKQVAWASDNGGVRLAASKTIVISLLGTGATAVDLTISITYHAAVSGGYLA